MSDNSNPIKTVSGRRLVINNVTDTANFSARRLSFNAKELNFIQEELTKWLSDMYGEDLDSDLCHSLMSGVVLLSICEKYMPNLKSLKKWNRNASPLSFLARDNITIFADVCVELGMRRSDVCNYSNFEKGELKQVSATLCAFAKLGMPKGLKKVSPELDDIVQSSYNPKFIGMDSLEEDVIELTDEEIAELNRQKEEEERIQALIEQLTNDIEAKADEFDILADKLVATLCKELDSIDIDSDTSDASKDKRASLTSVDLRSEIAEVKTELLTIKQLHDEIKTLKDELADNDGDTTSAVEIINKADKKIKDIEELLTKREEEEKRVREEEEERKRQEEEKRQKEEEERILKEIEELERQQEEEKRRLEEEERLRKEEEERLRKEEEERLRKEEEERLRKEEEEKKRIEEEERLRKEEEEKKRIEEEKRAEEERLRKEEEEKKRIEEEKRAEEERLRKEEEEKKRIEEEKRAEEERKRIAELESIAAEEEERLRREEEEAAKRCGCRNKKPRVVDSPQNVE